MIRRLVVFLFSFSLMASAQVTLHPVDNVSKIVSSKPEGTTFIFASGTYHLSHPILPKNDDKFIGETKCAPPASPCPAIISGAVVIGPDAKSDGTDYRVVNQRQHNSRGATTKNCDPGWLACILPEDLYFDGRPLRHLDSPSLPSMGEGEWWFDYNNHVIYFHDDPSGHAVESSVIDNAFGGPANHVTLQYLTVEKFASMYPVGAIGESQKADALTRETDWTVENCEIRLNHGFGVRVGYHIRILNNYIHDNGEFGIAGGIGLVAAPATQSANAGIVIEGNKITHNDYAHFDSQFGSGGIKFGATRGIVIRGNIIQNNLGSGIHFDDDSGDDLVDGNTISDNSDADALVQEIGVGTSTWRNNIITRNAAQLNEHNFGFQVAVRVSPGVHMYCNVLEVPAGPGIGAWAIGSSNRGNSNFPPFQYRTSTGNWFHDNTVIWDPGANGGAGMWHNDPGNQPNFFGSNTPPDYNEYHLSSRSASVFVYDNDNSRSNRMKSFRNLQGGHAEVHSAADTNNTSGWPEVSIKSPLDQSPVSNPVAVSAAASDKSGIRKVEFYVDWKLQTTMTSPPYDFNWADGTTGPHIVAAMAYSNAGIRNCYAVTLNRQ
jgi:parallel beta-helix repeat protein